MKILITGASGFVGGFLVAEALSRGLEVYAGVRATSDRSYLTDENIRFVEIDFKNTTSLQSLLEREKFDYIIHNAGITKTKNKSQYYEVNADYCKVFIEVIKSSGFIPKKFTFVSSLAAYGPADHQESGIVTNESLPHPVTHYGKSKLAGEAHLKSQVDIPYIIIRPTAVYGPREKDLLAVFQSLNKGLDLYVGLQTQRLTFIYVKDLVRVMIDATLSQKSNKCYFVHDNLLHTAETFNGIIKNKLGKKALKLRIPIPILRGIAFLVEKTASIWGNYPALNIEKVNELECRSWNCDISALKSDFGFIPAYNLEAGLKETIEWYQDNNWL